MTKTTLPILAVAAFAATPALSDKAAVLDTYANIALAKYEDSLTTAQALTPAQLTKVTESIKGHAPSGSTLKIEAVVDPRLIGGLTASIGEKFFDLSLMTTVKKYEAVIAAPL